MKAKDLMITVPEYLKPDHTLKDAVNLLKVAQRGEERVGVKGLPVLDEAGKLVGMLLHEGYPEGGPSCLYEHDGAW